MVTSAKGDSAHRCEILESLALETPVWLPDLATLEMLVEIISENDILTQESAVSRDTIAVANISRIC